MDNVLEIFQNCDALEKNTLKYSSTNKLQYSELFYAHNGEKQNLDVNWVYLILLELFTSLEKQTTQFLNNSFPTNTGMAEHPLYTKLWMSANTELCVSK